MKRLTAFILMLLVSFSNLVFSEDIISEETAQSGADLVEVQENVPAEITTEVRDEVKKLLTALKLMSEVEINQTGYVTRDFAAEAVMRFTGENTDGTATGNIYRDIDADTSYAYSIERATSLGYFNGTGNGLFEPELEITDNEMAEVFIRFTGYSAIKDYSPAKLQIMRNIGCYGKLTYGGLANMIFNVLELNIIDVNQYSDIYVDYSISEDITILNDIFDVYEFEGVITENGLTGLWTDTDVTENEIAVRGKNGNEAFLTGESGIADAIGQYVVLNFYYDRDSEEKVCVSYHAPESKNDISEMSLLDIDYELCDENFLYYYENEDDKKTQKIKLSVQTAVIYNGTYYAESDFNLGKLRGLEGNIVAIDNNKDGVTDVLNITAYEIYIASSVVLSTKVMAAKNRTDKLVLDEQEYDRFSFTDKEGKKAYLEDIVSGMLVSVAQNSPSSVKRVISATLIDDETEGVVNGVYEEDGYTFIQLDDGDEYRILFSNTSAPKVKQGVILHLTAFGNVAWIDYSNLGGFMFGIVYDCLYDEDEETVTLRIINEQDVREDIPVSDKVRIDGSSVSSLSAAYRKLKEEQSVVSTAEATFPQGCYPVLYRIKNDGTLAEVDTPMKGVYETKNSLTPVASGNHMMNEQLVLGATVALREDTKCFRIYDEKGKTPTRERFMNPAYTYFGTVDDSLSVKGIYDYCAYSINEDSLYVDFLIIHRTYGVGDDAITFMLDEISRAYDETTEEVLYKMKGIDGGKTTEVFISPDYEETFLSKNLVRGDWFRWTDNAHGHVIAIDDSKNITVKQNEDSIELNNISKGETDIDKFRKTSSNVQLIYGYVTERQDDLITISAFVPGTSIDGKRNDADMQNQKLLIKIPSSMPITVYDSEEETVTVGTYDEILDYKTYGKRCSLVAIRYKSATMKEVAVFNNYSLYQD